MINEAEVLLIAWANYVRGGQGSGIGHDSIISRLMEEGVGASHTTTKAMPTMPTSVEIVEQAVLKMPKALQRPVKHKYLGQESDRIAAHKLKITTREFQARINNALIFVSRFLVEN